MRQFPSGGTYVAALQNTGVCFEHPHLRGGTPDLNNLGQPRPISGQFASVFAVTSASGHRYAVKCFTREVPDQARRYRAISNHLAPLNRPWRVGFEYVTRGIHTDDWYPVLKMEWVQATDLSRWIDGHLDDRPALAKVASHFANLVTELADVGIGHGDLQHGNVLVTPAGDLKLVDYDGMYVPALGGLEATEFGHRHYQSPLRTQHDFGPDLDRFAAWVIYLSLFAVAVDPMLWRQLREDGAEHLLLARDDFTQPATSYRLYTLLNHSEPQIRRLAGQVRDLLSVPLDAVPALRPVEFAADMATVAPQPTTPVAAAAGGLPIWLSGHVTSPAAAAGQARFRQRRPLLSGFGRVGPVLLVVGAVLLAVGVVVGVALAALALLLVALFLSGSAVAFRRTPEAQQAAEARTAWQQARRQVRATKGDIGAAEGRKQHIATDIEKVRASNAANERALANRHQQDLTSAQNDIQRRLAGVDQQLANVRRHEDQAVSEALRQSQERHVTALLATHRIGSEKIAGIGKKIVGNLQAKGIVTAADFTDVRFRTVQYQNVSADFLLRNGTLVHVEGVGEVKATALRDWRETHRQRAVATQPRTLQASTTNAINNRFAAETVRLQSARKQVETDLAHRTMQLTQQHRANLTALRDELRRKNAEAARAQDAQNVVLVKARQELSAGNVKLAQTAARVETYRRIRYLRYVGFLVGTGRSRAVRQGG